MIESIESLSIKDKSTNYSLFGSALYTYVPPPDVAEGI